MADEAQKISKGYRAALKRWMQESLPVEDRLAGLAPEQRLAGLAPEQVGEAMGEHVVLALPDEALRSLSADYLATLPAEVQRAVAARLRKKPRRTASTPARRPRKR